MLEIRKWQIARQTLVSYETKDCQLRDKRLLVTRHKLISCETQHKKQWSQQQINWYPFTFYMILNNGRVKHKNPSLWCTYHNNNNTLYIHIITKSKFHSVIKSLFTMVCLHCKLYLTIQKSHTFSQSVYRTGRGFLY